MKFRYIGISALVVIVAAIGLVFFPSAAEKSEIAVFLPSAQNPFWIEVRRGAEENAAAKGGEVKLTIHASGDLDAATQVEQLKSVLSRGTAQAIVLGVANNRSPAPIIALYNKKQIPVVLIDTKLSQAAAKEAGAKWDAFIGSDNREGGIKAAEAMAAALSSAKRKVLLIKGSFVHQSAIDRAEGFIHGAGDHLVVVEREGEWSRQRASELTTSVMLREPVDGIFASNDDMALGAIAALKNLKISKENWPIIIGFDATPAGRQAIERGDMYASVGQDARGMGAAGVTRASKLIAGIKGLQSEVLIPVKVVLQQ